MGNKVIVCGGNGAGKSTLGKRLAQEFSSDEDKYSMDAPEIVEKAGKRYMELGASENLVHKRYPGGHAMTEERFRDIIEWIVMND